MNEAPDKRHPNSPLIEVAFEIRFVPQTAIECRRHELQRAVQDAYPILLVPNAEPGVPPALQPYRFEREDGNAGIMVALNMFGYFCRRYPGFDDFASECLRAIQQFTALFEIGNLTRIGLRHINIIPFVRNHGLLPVEDFLVLGEHLSTCLGGLENFNLAFVHPAQGGTITTRLEAVTRTDGSHEAFWLDFDYAKEGEFALADMETHLREAHDESAKLFHKLLTKTYRDFIKGVQV